MCLIILKNVSINLFKKIDLYIHSLYMFLKYEFPRTNVNEHAF